MLPDKMTLSICFRVSDEVLLFHWISPRRMLGSNFQFHFTGKYSMLVSKFSKIIIGLSASKLFERRISTQLSGGFKSNSGILT